MNAESSDKVGVDMKSDVKRVIDQTMKMSSSDRAAIAEYLIGSLDGTTEKEVEQAWQEEIQRRLAQIDSSDVECIPWEQVRARLGKN